MAKKNHPLMFQIILFLFLIIFSFQEKHQGSDGILDIDFDHQKGIVEYEVENSKKNQRFQVSFTQGQGIPFYLKIELTVKGESPTPLLCFSSSDASCDQPEQLVKNPNGDSVLMWLRREQFTEDESNLYLKAICQEDGANYIIKVESAMSAQYGTNFVYSYAIGKYNREMIFEIVGRGETGILVAAVEGGKTPTLSLDGGFAEQFRTGQVAYLTVETGTNRTITKITIKGATDDYVTLSVHFVDEENGYSELLEPNGPEITGHIVDGVLQEECFKMTSFTTTYKNSKTFYLTGRMHSMYGLIYLKDESGKVIETSKEEVTDGLLSKIIESDNKERQICVGFPESTYIESYSVFFTISLTEPNSLKSLYNYYPPQIPGHFYRRYLPKGKTAFFSPMALDNTAKKYNYNMYSITGYSKMGITKCTSYPNCEYSTVDDLTLPKSSNRMTIWTTEQDNSSTMGKQKDVIVVECKDDDNENNGYCLFETSVLVKGQTINLVHNEKLSFYALKDEKGTFKLELGNGVKAARLTIDIMIFSGDISFNVKEAAEQNEFTFHKYYLSNKVFFQFDLGESATTELHLDFTASLNTFFTIQYEYGTRSVNQMMEVVPSGENYLVQIDPTSANRRKYVFLENFRYKKEKPYLANFFALNCDFSVKRNNEEVKFFDGYAQEVLTPSSNGYKNEFYNYEITITEPDLSNYNHKMCMLYVEGIESEDTYDKEVIVGDNINQQIIFEEGFNKVRFLYPQADYSKDLAIYANVIDKAYYQIKVFLNNENSPLKSYTVTRTNIFYIPGRDIMDTCTENKLCSVIVQVELTGELIKTNPMIEITIRQIKNVPSYIQKGIAKRDFTCGDNFYYLYMDIGKNEVGEVLVDFLRDFGNIWGKVVRKDQTSVDEEANWRGIYRMPSEDWEDSLEYNRYIKKLLVRPEDTQDCIEGCYLLLSIQISQIGEYVDDSKFYPFSILTRITPSNRAYTDIPKVVIQVDEYIIGNVDVAENERIYEFYEIWLPHDASKVEFDWQSGVAGLYVNLGGIRPTTKNADFKLLPPGRDSILTLTKQQILAKYTEKKMTPPEKNSIQDVNLVIGVWTDKTSSRDTEIYSLRVHEVEDDDNIKLDIIEVNADKKIMCKPHALSENEYRCLFMITYDNDDTVIYTPFFGHAASVDVSSIAYMYASFIERDLFDELNYEGLGRAIPTHQTATYNSRDEGVDYIYISPLDKKKYLFINVISDSPEDIMLLTNMPLYNYIAYDIFEFYPTPGNEQLLSVSGEQLRLRFATYRSILVNIESLWGEGEVWFSNQPDVVYSLRGRGDRLTISADWADTLIIHRRTRFNSTRLQKMDDPGFLFYISYYLKENQNFDEVIYGKSLEFGYNGTDLPVILYSKIGNYSSDINVAVTFKDFHADKTGEYISSPLSVRASLIKESTIYKAKKDPDLAPSLDRLTLGSYDTALKTAQVMLTKESISAYNLKIEDNPTLYLSIDKNREIDDKVYDQFTVEVQFSKANEGVIPTEKVYHYGRVGDQSRMTFYKLRVDKQKPYMRVQIAFNSDYVNFYINDVYSYQRNNMTFLEEKYGRGKSIVTIDTSKLNKEIIYLVFFKTKTDAVNSLYNYAFKYINALKLDEFVDYKVLTNEELVIKENINKNQPEESTITCTFHRLDIPRYSANVTYFFKVVNADSYLNGEKTDTIAVTESPYYSVYSRNPIDSDDLITLTAKGDFRRWSVLQVIAQVQKDTILEYVAYKGKYTYRKPESGGSSSSGGSTTMFYVIAGILFALVVGLIIAIIIFKIKNEELVEQVKHVSFQNTNSANYKSTNVDPNNLIQSKQ